MSTPETKLVNVVLSATITKHLEYQRCIRVPVDATEDDILRYGAELKENIDGGRYSEDGPGVWKQGAAAFYSADPDAKSDGDFALIDGLLVEIDPAEESAAPRM